MGEIKLLDCTLRDGGFVNDWEFGHANIINIFERLVSAKIDIIELGFIDDRRPFDINRTIMPDTDAVNKIFAGLDKGNSMLVGMIDFGTCSIDHISECNESILDGIRVIFKKQSLDPAIAFCKELQSKGYKLFFQPVSITSYTDEELYNLVNKVNELAPYSVSIVDTYGLLHKNNLLHYFNLINDNLAEQINIGYHSHNNFQLGYSNSIELLHIQNERSLVVDASVYGMGKGAGNANIELLATYMNDHFGKNYDINQILEIIDVNLMNIYSKYPWGYSLNYFLSASNDCHPSYVKYLVDKRTLSVKSINEILNSIESKSKLTYNQEHIEELYLKYQNVECNDEYALKTLSKELNGKKILLLGPGQNAKKQAKIIQKYIRDEQPVVIANNYIPIDYNVDYIFLSNSKRYVQLANRLNEIKKEIKIIATSNITKTYGIFSYNIEYGSLLDMNGVFADNSLLMLLRMLMNIGVEKVALAGFDGYALTKKHNYIKDDMEYHFTKKLAKAVNEDVIESMRKMRSKGFEIEFITKSYYDID